MYVVLLIYYYLIYLPLIGEIKIFKYDSQRTTFRAGRPMSSNRSRILLAVLRDLNVLNNYIIRQERREPR